MTTAFCAILLLLVHVSMSTETEDKKLLQRRQFETYGVDLRACEQAMCWASKECGGRPSNEPIVIIGTNFDARCRNVVYIRRQTSHSIIVEIMWEQTDMSISVQAASAAGNMTGEDLFVCSSAKETGMRGLATTTSDKFVVYQRPEPENLDVNGRPYTYCRFDLKIRVKIGDYMKGAKLSSLCVIVKRQDETNKMEKCMLMRHNDDYYNKFNSNKAFNDSTAKVYTVFLVAYLMLLALLAMPIYLAWRESLVNFRYLRAFFKFRRTLIELPEEEIVKHQLKKNKKGENSDPILALLALAESANTDGLA